MYNSTVVTRRQVGSSCIPCLKWPEGTAERRMDALVTAALEQVALDGSRGESVA